MQGIVAALFFVISGTLNYSYAADKSETEAKQESTYRDKLQETGDKSEKEPELYDFEARSKFAYALYRGSHGVPGVEEETAFVYDRFVDSEEKLRQGLLKLVMKFDKDGDRYVTRKELVRWFLQSFRVLAELESESHYVNLDANLDGKITYKEFLWMEHGLDLENKKSRKSAIPERVRRKFLAADLDHDDALTVSEYFAFSHPQELPRMKSYIVEDFLKSHDKDRDGYVSYQEYYDKSDVEGDSNFHMKEDLNKDRRLDGEEIYRLQVRDSDQRAMEEAFELIGFCDDDRDGVLSYEEILEHVVDIANHKVTHYGDHLNHVHRFTDEL